MFAAGRQSWYNSQGANAFGNASITGFGTGTTPALVFANTVSSSTYLTYQVPYQDPYGINTDVPAYKVEAFQAGATGNLIVSGNTAQLDILVVGAGGANPIGATTPPTYTRGATGGQVRFYSNVIVPVGTYTLRVSGGGDVGGSGNSTITVGPITITSVNGSGDYTQGGLAYGGSGAGAANVGGVGGAGLNVSQFAGDLTWIVANGNPYFGGGGGGADSTATNTYYAGGITSGYTIQGNLGVGSGGVTGFVGSFPTYQIGLQNFGGGAGAGTAGSLYTAYYDRIYGGSGVIIIRYRFS